MKCPALAAGLGVWVAIASACGTAPATDAGTVTSSDAAGGGDAAGGNDAAGADGSAAASCEAVVQGVIDVCGTSRKCEHLEYKKLCVSGNPAGVAALFGCFGSNMCWIPGDENSAGPCIDAAISAVDPQAGTFTARLCALCGDAGHCAPISGLGIAPWYLAPPQADTLRSCVSTATSCAAASQCLGNAASAVGFNPAPTGC